MCPSWGHFLSQDTGCDLILGGLRVRVFFKSYVFVTCFCMCTLKDFVSLVISQRLMYLVDCK